MAVVNGGSGLTGLAFPKSAHHEAQHTTQNGTNKRTVKIAIADIERR
jgi:hypothetical protein